MRLGSNLQRIVEKFIGDVGEDVVVTRKLGGTTTNRTLSCTTKPLNLEAVTELGLEGTLNASDKDPTLFVFPGGSDVREATDRVAFNGTTYRLITPPNPPRLNAVDVAVYLVGVREGKA